MPLDSLNKFLTAPVRAVRSFRRHLHSVSYQEPIRRPLGLYGLHRPPGSLRFLGPLGPLRPLGPLKPLGPLGPLGPPGPPRPLGQSGQLGQLGQLKQLKQLQQ